MDTAVKKKTCMICQPHGIGDILFVQKIILHYAELGFHVVVPILERLSWMRYYIVPHEDVEYPLISVRDGVWGGGFKFANIFLALHAASSGQQNKENASYANPVLYNGGDEENSFIFLALGSSYQWLKENMMPAKYLYAGLDYADWTDFVHLKRREHVERELYDDVLGLKDDSLYTLVNEKSSSKTIPLNVPGKVVTLRELDAFTLFDWSLVIEKAAQIVTIDTSLVILTEVLKQKKPLYMISRYDPPSFDPLKEILTLDWNLVLKPEDLKVNPVE